MRLKTRTHTKTSPNLRRGFFIVLSVLCISSQTLFSANTTSNYSILHGQTLDHRGKTIPYVSLTFQDSEVFLLSDENGHFSYSSSVTSSDSVFVHRIGYKDRTLTVDDLYRLRTITLIPEVLRMESVSVEGESGSHRTLTVLGEHKRTQGSAMTDHKNLLSRIPGISIKSYGGPAGISTLSMDGGPSSHTLVMVNGIDISSAQNGEADLSQLPLPFVESMSYLPYDITQSGNGGIDGVIKLESGDQRTHFNFSQGSFGHRALDISLNKQIAGFWTSFQIGQRKEEGNYPVVWDGSSSIRRNNQLEQEFVALSVRKMIRSDLYWQFTSMSSQQSRGVAGLLWSPDTVSHRDDQLTLLGSTVGWIRELGSSHLYINSRQSRENYINPYLRIDSDHQLRGYNAKLEHKQHMGEWLELRGDLIYNLDEITSSNTDTHTRKAWSASLAPTLQIMKSLLLTPTVKLHYSPDLYERYLRDIQIHVPIDWGVLSNVAFSSGEVFKYPSFNDLYWEPGGNPDLDPEETNVTTIQSNFDLRQFGSLHLQWQKKESENLIQWMPVLSYWQPGNVQSATRESSKALWKIDLTEPKLSAYAHITLIKTLDHQRDLPLRYAPEQTSAMGLTWSPHSLELNLQYNYVSDRISMYSYPQDIIIGQTSLLSGSIANTWSNNWGELTLILSVDNLGDVNHETIKGYPEPGRSYRISTKFSR